jgi:hypothetical protein
VPLSAILEIVTLPLPVFVTVTGSDDELPAFTFPNARFVVLNDSVNVAPTPVPLSVTTAGEFGALLVTVTLPVTAPADCGRNCTLKLLDCPAPNEIGSAKVPRLKPVPLALTWVIESVPVPLFVSWIVCVLETPTVTLPKLALAGVIVSAGCKPVPLTAITALAPCEVDTVTFPVTFSDAVGLNETFSVVLCPAVSVSGVVTPLSVKSLALTVTPEIVTLTFPLFVIVTVFELDVPALMLPNARLVGFAVSAGVPATPVPLSGTLAGEFGALLVTVTLPVAAPADCGRNCTLKLLDCPAASEIGSAKVPRLKPAPLALTCVTESVPVPLFVS